MQNLALCLMQNHVPSPMRTLARFRTSSSRLNHAHSHTLNRPVTVAIPIACPLAHNDPCNKEHTDSEEFIQRSKASELSTKTIVSNFMETERRYIIAQQELFDEREAHICTKRKLNSQVVRLTIENSKMKKKIVKKKRDVSGQTLPGRNVFHPFDSDGYFFSDVDESVRRLYPSLPSSPTKMDIDIKSEDSSPLLPKVSLPQKALSTPTVTPASTLDSNPAFTSTRPDFNPAPTSAQRAFSAPVLLTQQRTMPEVRANTAPPSLSRNTLTARRCTSKGPSPVSYVKFLDVPYLPKEQYLEMLKENKKWSSATVSSVETFGMKTKEGNFNIKVSFKDDTQSTIAKKLLTTSITFGPDTRRCRPWYLQTRSSQ
ncbi:hypothetical protein JOM56_012941 [Amanita muscaria]